MGSLTNDAHREVSHIQKGNVPQNRKGLQKKGDEYPRTGVFQAPMSQAVTTREEEKGGRASKTEKGAEGICLSVVNISRLRKKPNVEGEKAWEKLKGREQSWSMTPRKGGQKRVGEL